AMFVWVFFENLGKGGYTPAGYAGVINYYIKSSHSPAAWKWVMGLMASHAAMAAPMQAATEISLGILLVIGLLTRPASFVAFLFLDGDYSDRPSELPIILAPIIEGRADITLGSRFGGKSNPGALAWPQSIGNRLAAGLIRLLYGVKVSDLGPFRAGRTDVLCALALEEVTYGWAVEMIVKG